MTPQAWNSTTAGAENSTSIRENKKKKKKKEKRKKYNRASSQRHHEPEALANFSAQEHKTATPLVSLDFRNLCRCEIAATDSKRKSTKSVPSEKLVWMVAFGGVERN
jgi:hypothetical protein